MTSIPNDLEKEWYAQQFGVRRSIRYHQRRRAFFDRLDQFGNMLSVILGSTAIYGIIEKDYRTLALIATGLVTVLSAINLVLGSSRRAREHSDLARQYVELEKRLLSSPDEVVLKQVEAERLSVEADEPPVLRVLDCICHNEQMRAEGYPAESLATIKWWQRLFAQVFDLREDLIHAPS